MSIDATFWVAVSFLIFIDELILRQCGYSDFEKYRLSDEELIRDFFIPDEIAETVPTKTKSVYN